MERNTRAIWAPGSLDGGYNADFGGIVFGGDYAFGDFRVGMALNAGSGTARSRWGFNATKNVSVLGQ